MAFQFTTVEEPSFARGIDARSAENQIRDGYVRDLVNCDIVEGRAKKRKGYATYAGNIPVRVASVRQIHTASPPQICFTLDESIDLSRVASSPILVYGKSGTYTTGQSPFTTTGNSAKYYPAWESNLKKLLLVGPSIITAPLSEHSIPSQDIYVGISSVTGSDLSSAGIFPDISIDDTTFEIAVDANNGSPATVPVFLFYKDGRAILGQKYAATHIPVIVPIVGNYRITIPAATHGLLTYNIVGKLYKQDPSIPTKWNLAVPDKMTLDFATGEVEFTVSETGNYRVLLTTVSLAQSYNGGTILLGGKYTFTVLDIESPYILYSLYDSLGEEILPDEVKYDDVAKSLTFEFASDPGVVQLYFDYGTIRANEICVSDTNAAVSSTDNKPQLTIYGLNHETLYGDEKEVNRRGWATHIDSYRSPRTTHMVAGLGGNLFAALGPSNTYFPTDLLPYTPTYFPRLSVKVVTGGVYIAPAFCDTGSIPPRTRGIISFSSGGTNWAKITAAAYQSGSGWTRYTLSTPNLGVTGTPISTQTGLEDYFTIQSMSHSRHRGTFKIKGVSYNPDIVDPLLSTITIDVINPNITTSDYDDSGTSGLGGVFTDHITTATVSPFLANDIVLSSTYGDETQLSVISTNSSSPYQTVVGQVYSPLHLSSGLTLTGRRTSASVPLRDINGTPISSNIVLGDTIYFSDIDYPLQVVGINSSTHTITLSEAVTWEDNISLPATFSVKERWIPAEVPTPDSGDTLLPRTTVQHLSANPYSNQPFLRSAMVQNNMYLTNGDDEVYKYDGQHFYRAGIIPWQPGLFLSTEEVNSGGIPLVGFPAPIVVGPLAGDKLEVSKSDSVNFRIGDVYLFTNASGFKQYLTLENNVEKDNSKHFLTFVEPLEFTALGTSPTLSLVFFARYYFRLNIKDVNGVITSSAVTGAEDFIAAITPTAAKQQKVHLRLVGLPVWDQYDFRNENIELEVYRTNWFTRGLGEVPTFYRLPQTKACPFVGADGYMDFVDTYNNTVVNQPDSVVGVLSPTPLPADWDEPPRAKYITTAGNRLVLANVTDWPTLAISYFTNQELTQADFNDQKFTFYRDVNDSSLTTTNMLNRVTYQLTTNVGVVATLGSTTGGFTISVTPPTAPVAGDWVYLYFTTNTATPLDFSGWWQINSVSGSGPYICTIKSTKAYVAPVVGAVINAVFATTSGDIPVFIDNSTILRDHNMNMVNGTIAGFKVPSIRIIRRLGEAINATMRMVDTTIPAYSTFTPWIIARSESDTYGQLIVKQPRVETTQLGMRLTTISNAKTYVNGELITSSVTPVKSLTTRYSSRLLVSYDNYPEIFDNPWTINTDASDSAIDVNSADGQEITGVIPFFGESAFGSSLQGGVLVVFKQNSIYLVSLEAKANGQNPVQRLETQGLGCTAPYSIAPTKDGIAFANDSGVYVLRPNQRIEYLGRFVERLWQNSVDKNYLELVQGHHYGVGRQYKLSVPVRDSNLAAGYMENSQVLVYNHTGEATDEPGGWGRYTNHPATGWANLFQDAFFSTTEGAVKRISTSDEGWAYLDDANAIESILEARATAFNNTAIRKVVATVTVHYRSGANSDNTKVYMATDLRQEYDLSSAFRVLTKPGLVDGLGTASGQDVVSIAHSFPKRKCIYIAIKIVNNGKGENVEIAGFSYTVAGLSTAGVKQAAETE